MTAADVRGSILGHAVARLEDPGVLRGEVRYVDDLPIEGTLHVHFVRSPVAHARITELDVSDAAAMPGVVAVYRAGDLDVAPVHGFVMLPPTFNRPPLATERVRFVGDIVAAVVAETPQQAADAADAVIVDYDDLPVVVDPEAAAEPGAPVIWEEHGSNVAFEFGTGPVEGLMDGADVVVEARLVNQRLAGIPMETNGCVAVPGRPEGGLTLYASTQAAHGVRDSLAGALGLEPATVRVVAPEGVGGGFGPKTGAYPEFILATKLALTLGRPVKWRETRSENLVAMVHGRGQVQRVRLGVRNDGTVVGLDADVVGDAGAYPAMGAFLVNFTHMMGSGVYKIPKIQWRSRAVMTNTPTTGAYRGAGRPEATALIERALDMAARRIGMDPVEIRRVNFVQPGDFPYTPPTGAMLPATYDIGDYAKALDAVCDAAGYADLRAEQEARRARGDTRQLGIGVSTYVEVTAPAGMHTEYGRVEVGADGTVTATVGTSSHGQGHWTAFAMLVADTLGVPLESVRLVQGDTDAVPRGAGTMGSRSLQTAGNAVYAASKEVLAKAKELAAHLLEASPDDIVVGDGGLNVAGVPASRLSWAELARAAADDARRPEGMEAGLAHELDFNGQASTFPFGAHIAVVEVDTETGRVELLRHVAVDDCGRILNPLLVAGQQHGGIAQGIAQALFEEVRYDEHGNPQTANLMDYAMPSAAELPSFEVSNTETPSPLNPLGAKGIGESGTIGSTPAVQNAVIDALAPFGVEHLDMPATAEKVWRAIARSSAAR
jgi:carbon-monoxide dehydrogenase large subunit